jgi:hypothetical protein
VSTSALHAAALPRPRVTRSLGARRRPAEGGADESRCDSPLGCGRGGREMSGKLCVDQVSDFGARRERVRSWSGCLLRYVGHVLGLCSDRDQVPNEPCREGSADAMLLVDGEPGAFEQSPHLRRRWIMRGIPPADGKPMRR